MLIKPGSSTSAMWLYVKKMDEFATLDPTLATEENVSKKLTELCPEGWTFGIQGSGQWGLWPDDMLKYFTHSLLHLDWTNHKMVEVLNSVHS